jgi:hypothetical protein
LLYLKEIARSLLLGQIVVEKVDPLALLPSYSKISSLAHHLAAQRKTLKKVSFPTI